MDNEPSTDHRRRPGPTTGRHGHRSLQALTLFGDRRRSGGASTAGSGRRPPIQASPVSGERLGNVGLHTVCYYSTDSPATTRSVTESARSRSSGPSRPGARGALCARPRPAPRRFPTTPPGCPSAPSGGAYNPAASSSSRRLRRRLDVVEQARAVAVHGDEEGAQVASLGTSTDTPAVARGTRRPRSPRSGGLQGRRAAHQRQVHAAELAQHRQRVGQQARPCR